MFKDEYRETFSRIKASNETLMEVLNMKQSTKRTISRVPRLALIVAMVALLTACAVGFNALDMLEAAFGENGNKEVIYQEYEYVIDSTIGTSRIVFPEMERLPVDEVAEELVTPYITVIDQSATNTDGSILTVEAGLYDPATYTGVLYLSLKNPNGLPEYEVMNNGRILWDQEDYYFNYLYYPEEESRIGYFYLDEERSEETKLYMTYRFIRRDEQDTMTIQFFDSEIGVTFPVPTAELRTMTLMDGSIVLSPIGLYDQSGSAWWDKDVSISFLDGTEMVLYKSGIWKVNGNYRHASLANYYVYASVHTSRQDISYGLSRIVDLDNVKSIIIDGTEYFPD